MQPNPTADSSISVFPNFFVLHRNDPPFFLLFLLDFNLFLSVF